MHILFHVHSCNVKKGLFKSSVAFTHHLRDEVLKISNDEGHLKIVDDAGIQLGSRSGSQSIADSLR